MSAPGSVSSGPHTTSNASALQAHVAHTNENLGVPSFVWLGSDLNEKFVADAKATPVDIAWQTLRAVKGSLKLNDTALAAATVTAVRDLGNGPIITRFGQNLGGVEVFGTELSVMMKPDKTPVAITGSLAPSTKQLGKGWSVDAKGAIAIAYNAMTGNSVATGAMANAGNDAAGADRYSFNFATPNGMLYNRGRAKRVWWPQPEGLLPAWYVEVDASNGRHADSQLKSFVLNGNKGTVLFSNDLMASDSYSYRVWADGSGPKGLAPLDSPYGNAVTPNAIGMPVANPVEPSYLFSSLVTLPNVPFSQPNDYWLPSGATELNGNNVRAYADLVDPDGYTPMSEDILVTPTSPGNFDRFYDPNQLPGASTNNIQATTTNLFFTINYMHDLFYDSGWTETMRNPQTDNYGRGGVGGDQIHAESQDFSGVDNANASTPADGQSPRIQMYLWDYIIDQSVTVKTGATSAGTYTNVVAAGWGPLSFDVTKDVVRWVDTTGGGHLGCNAGGPPVNSVMGKIALVDRGTCNFTEKATNAKAAGAVAMLLSNATDGVMQQGFGFNSADPLIPDLFDFPSMMVAHADGDKMIADAATALNIRLYKSPPHRDGSLDGTIMSHEWGHILSNRLIGNANGLTNNQGRGMGEGWSDFVSLLTYIRPTDLNVAANANWNGVYPMGVYAFYGNAFDVTYWGIRRYPYSNDMTKNPLMFRHIAGTTALPTNPAPVCGTACGNNYEVHNTGEVWTSMLWDCYVGLLRDNSYTFDTASKQMRDYLVTSLAATPKAPTFVEARDAMLLAASLNSATHPNDLMTFANAFARRGLGTGAVAASRTSTTNSPVTESTIVGGDIALVSVSVDDDTTSCDHDHVLDGGEIGTVSVKVKNTGVVPLNAVSVTLSSATTGITFSAPTQTLAAPLPMFGTTTLTFPIAMDAATAAITSYSITVSMNDPALVTGPPIPRTGTANFVGNYDWSPASSATDDSSAPASLWSTGYDPALYPLPWARIITPGTTTGVSWFGQNPPATGDTYLVSPPLHVGAGNFSFTFKNAYDFEFFTGTTPTTYFDGGVVEISTNGGATWSDLGSKFTVGGYNTTLYDGTDPDLGTSDNPLKGRMAFGGTSTGFPAFLAMPATVDLGTTYANSTVLIRFRVGADQSGSRNGWLIDDMTFTGLTDTPFTTQVTDRRLCGNNVPVANAGPDQSVLEGASVMLDGSGSSDADAADVLTYHWTQTSGPVVVLSSSSAVKPTFTAPQVPADTVLTFQLVIDDGHVFSPADTVNITVQNIVMDMAMGPDMTVVEDMTTPPTPADMTVVHDMTTPPADDMAEAEDMTQAPPPDMAKGGNHGGCSAAGPSSGTPAAAFPLVGLALVGFAIRRRRRA